MQCAMCDNKVCRDGQDCTGRRDQVAALYDDPSVRRTARVAGEVEARLYCQACRVEELIEFARRIGCNRLGVAFCIGLSNEARQLVEILSRHFQVTSVCCKVCGMADDQLRELKESKGMSPTRCNPLGQAQILNDERTDLNIIVGLCIGHDILFTEHSHAPVTTLIVKDRVLAHNPAGALYSGYLRRRLERAAARPQENDGKSR